MTAWPLWRARRPASVLVIVTRRIGDVLLATPLIRSLARAWPGVPIDALVFDGTQGVLAANGDLRRVITVAERPSGLRHFALLLRLARRYGLALSLVPGDRPTLYAFVAGRRRAGLLLDTRKERWKRALLDRWVPFDERDTHTVRMHLALAGLLGVAAHGEVAVGWRQEDAREADALLGGVRCPYAVLHVYPNFNYKMWRREAWIELAHALAAHGCGIVLTGGGERAELDYVASLAERMPAGTVNAAGRLSFGGSCRVVGRAALYVGPDTALTHAAAALGTPTVALFGPTDPVKWGPWPRGHPAQANPWRRCGSQRSGNVALLQGAHFCVPCLHEGCGRSVASFSDCLQELPAARVIAAAMAALRAGARATRTPSPTQ
jgi:heptosyltransferase-3